MTFAQRLASGRFPVALEITPPQKPLPSVLLRRARLLGACAHAVNVIQRPGRQPSLEACIELRRAGIEPVWHLVTRGRTREELAEDFATAREGGITQLLCIRGDHPGEDTPGTPSIREAVAMARELLPGAVIGATLNQYAPDPKAVLRNLLPKLAMGATYVQTQPVFEPEQLRPLADAARAAHPATKVVAMAMPILSRDTAERVAARLGVPLPDALASRLQGGESGGWELFGEILAALVASGCVDGVAIMTFEMDATPEMGANIIAALRAAGLVHETEGG